MKLFLAQVIVIAGLVAYDFVMFIIWDGAFPLEVHLSSKGGKKVSKVSAQSLTRKEWGELLRSDPPGLELNLKPVRWVEGQPFTVEVPCSGKESGFGRKVGYFQFHLLVLLVKYADGTGEYVAVEIPDGRAQREISVEVP